MALKLAVYGYDTDIGKLVIETLEEQHLPLDDFFPLSPLSGEYDAVMIDKKNYFVEAVDSFDFSKANVVLLLSTQDESSRVISKAQEKGCVVIDNSHLFSGTDKGELVVPELNPYDIKHGIDKKLIVPAMAPSLMLLLLLSAVSDEYGLARVNVTSLESVSELGRLGTETLAHESTMLLNGLPAEHPGFEAQLAFNLHPRIGAVDEDGYSDHENIIKYEVKEILGKIERGFDITCMQVPVFYGHTMSVSVETEDYATLDDIKNVFSNSALISFNDIDAFLTPVTDIINERKIMVSRLRQDNTCAKTFSFIAMMDNTRRGEAINLVELVKLVEKSL